MILRKDGEIIEVPSETIFRCPACQEIGTTADDTFSFVADDTRYGVFCMACWCALVWKKNPMMDLAPEAVEVIPQ